MTGLVEPGTLVMIIDDDAESRESMADALVMEGYAVHSCESPDAALAQLSAGARPSLVILDLWLPGIGSRGFIRDLRASAHAKVPVLVVSGEAALEQIETEADAVLRKPSELTTLVRAVDKLTSRASRVARRRSGRP